ncbi:adenosine receptor A3 [Patella vulgata]|uniref:adenosine receptor A3 n=1 Tax=Patella vulgata TaxID=6465 RepID=UPI00217F26EC|nr:adenosine receptor A3 [Patella vulgata]
MYCNYNCSHGNTTEPMMWQNYVFITINVVLIIFICSGNVLTIIAVLRTPVLQTVPNMYVTSLAVADLLAGAVLPLQILIFIPSAKHIVNDIKYLCLFRHVTFFVSVSMSVASMMAIAVDRALYISYPLRYEQLPTTQRTWMVIVCMWIFSLLIGTMPLYYNNWEPCIECSIFRVLKMEYQVYIQTSLFVGSCILTACCYGSILRIARRQQRHILKQTASQSSKPQLAKDLKLVKLFVLVFGVFFICYLPAVISVAAGHLGVYVPQMVTNITVPILVLNSGMNFVVYAVKNKDFRRAFVKMICTKRAKRNLVGPTVVATVLNRSDYNNR